MHSIAFAACLCLTQVSDAIAQPVELTRVLDGILDFAIKKDLDHLKESRGRQREREKIAFWALSLLRASKLIKIRKTICIKFLI